MNNYLGKTRKCQFCKDVYELDYCDDNRTRNTYCCGDCQYYGEVLPDFIESATGIEKQRMEEELENARKNKILTTNSL